MGAGKHSRRPRVAVLTVALVAVLSVFAVACGGGRSDSSGGTATTKAPAATDFGTMASPCGSGDAKGATAQGVTDTNITIGYGSYFVVYYLNSTHFFITKQAIVPVGEHNYI